MSFQFKSNLAIIIIAFLVISNQLFLQYWLSQKKYDAKVINVSGRQRMLSQRTMALVFDYELLKKEGNADLEALQETFLEWKNAHFYLIDGNEKLSIKAANSKISKRLKLLTPTIDFTEQLLDNIGNLNKEELTILKRNQTDFLIEMNQIVIAFEEESNHKFNLMMWGQLGFALLIILVIIFEVKFIFQPITEHLKSQNNALKNSNRTLEEYAYIASHDLRTPIQNSLNFLGLLKRTALSKLDDTEKRFFNYVAESTDRMNRTTMDLLNYSTSNDVNIETVETATVINNVLDDVQTKIEEKNAQISVGHLPETIKADENLIRLLIQNLLTNGLKFIPENKIPKIHISCKSKKHNHVFCVSDNGIGISEANLEKIFKIFQRLHSQKEYVGTGIGLSMCKRIIEGHQGDIWVESELGKGSQFYFSLPK